MTAPEAVDAKYYKSTEHEQQSRTLSGAPQDLCHKVNSTCININFCDTIDFKSYHHTSVLVFACLRRVLL